MIAVVLMGVSLMVVGKQWSVVKKRDMEQELLFRGNRVKAAIELYAADYQVRKAFRANVYPLTLQQLTEPPKRYLQVVYKDPMTGQDFELIKVNGEIRGVRSRSKETPLDQVHFKGVSSYSQVAFQVETQAGQPCMPTPNPLNPLAPSAPCPPATPPPGSPASPIPPKP